MQPLSVAIEGRTAGHRAAPGTFLLPGLWTDMHTQMWCDVFQQASLKSQSSFAIWGSALLQLVGCLYSIWLLHCWCASCFVEEGGGQVSGWLACLPACLPACPLRIFLHCSVDFELL
jgi:hypothetical protein